MKLPRSLAALVLAVPLALTACGGEDEDTDTGDTGAAGNATDEASGDDAGDGSGDEDATYGGLPDMGETLTIRNSEITPSNLREYERDPSNQICADVSFTVPADDEPLAVRGLAAWRLDAPDATQRSQTVSEETEHVLDQVEPGTTEESVICFDGPVDPGEYRLSFQEDFANHSERLEWSGSL